MLAFARDVARPKRAKRCASSSSSGVVELDQQLHDVEAPLPGLATTVRHRSRCLTNMPSDAFVRIEQRGDASRPAVRHSRPRSGPPCAADDPIDAARSCLRCAAWPSTEVARPGPSADVDAGWPASTTTSPDVQWKALRASWGGSAYCGATDRALQHDCVLAISRGGRYTLDNVVPACGPCNASKCNDEVTGWLRRRRFDERAFLLRQLEVRTALGLQPGSKPAVEAGVADTPRTCT